MSLLSGLLLGSSSCLCSVGQCDSVASQTVPVCSWFCTERALYLPKCLPLFRILGLHLTFTPRLTTLQSHHYYPLQPLSIFCLTSIPAFLACQINKHINKFPPTYQNTCISFPKCWSIQDHRAHCKIFKYIEKQWCHRDSLERNQLGNSYTTEIGECSKSLCPQKIVLVVGHKTTNHHLQMMFKDFAVWMPTSYLTVHSLLNISKLQCPLILSNGHIQRISTTVLK